MSRRLSSWPVERSLNGRSVVVASPCGATRRAGGRFHALPARPLRQPRAPAARRTGRAGGDARGGPAPLGRSRLGRRAQHRQGVGRVGPRSRPWPGPRARRSRGCRARGIPPRRREATRAGRGRSSRLGRVLLDHRLRRGRHARRSRPQLPGLGRAARRHRPRVAACARSPTSQAARSSPSSRSSPLCSNASARDSGRTSSSR